MRELLMSEIEATSAAVSAGGVCRAYLSTMGGTTLLAISVGVSEGLALAAGIEIFSIGAGFGQGVGDLVCP